MFILYFCLKCSTLKIVISESEALSKTYLIIHFYLFSLYFLLTQRNPNVSPLTTLRVAPDMLKKHEKHRTHVSEVRAEFSTAKR